MNRTGIASWLRFDRFSGVVLLLVAVFVSLTLGRYPLGLGALGRFFLASIGAGQMPDPEFALVRNLVVEIRLPRILSAILVGASLSASGSAYQAVFRNPLVSPSLLGVLAGSAAGAALAIVMDAPWGIVQVSAFVGGVVAVVVALGISRLFGSGSMVLLVLGGIVSGTIFSSFLTMIKYVADPQNQLPAIVYWLMGSLSQSDMGLVSKLAIPMLAGIVGLCLLGRALDALAMGDDEARSLGIPASAVRLATIALATMISSMTVSMAGMVGWIGLVVPHVTRLLVGPGNARLVPASAWVGAVFLLGADGLSRNLFATELPLGIVTEWLGIPVFIAILGRAKKGWAE